MFLVQQPYLGQFSVIVTYKRKKR